jgi:hypothetical protein
MGVYRRVYYYFFLISTFILGGYQHGYRR